MGWSSHHPVGLIYYAPQHCYRGYTLTANTRGGKDAGLLDMEGRICHRWHTEEGIGYAQLLRAAPRPSWWPPRPPTNGSP